MTALWATIAAGSVLAGILLVVLGVVGTRRPPAPPSYLRRRVRSLLSGEGWSAARQRRTRLLAVGTVVAIAGAWWFTGIAMAGLISGAAVLGVPWLFGAGHGEQRAIAKLEAIEGWTRRLGDLVGTGVGLHQAIAVSVRDAPAILADELHQLGVQLRAGVAITTALDNFAHVLGDASADEVIIRLKLHATDRGPRLVDVLSRISDGISREVMMRREIWASRADPRLTTRFMTALALVVFGLLFLNTTYMRPYRTFQGQLVLAACTALFVGLLIWIRRLSQPRRAPRLLARTSDRAVST